MNFGGGATRPPAEFNKLAGFLSAWSRVGILSIIVSIGFQSKGQYVSPFRPISRIVARARSAGSVSEADDPVSNDDEVATGADRAPNLRSLVNASCGVGRFFAVSLFWGAGKVGGTTTAVAGGGSVGLSSVASSRT